MADDEILAELEAAGKDFDKDAEIKRVLGVFRLNAYAVLDLQPGVPDSDIKKTYRAKSLLIHPDKTTNPQAPEAFDRLKKAQTLLLDEKARHNLDESIADARHLLMKEKKIDKNSDEVKTEEFAKEWREKTKWVIMDYEADRQKSMKAQLREEGRQQRKEEEEIKERKRKREHEDAWDKSRESRISSWRDFQGGGGKGGGKGGAKGGGKGGAPGAKKKKVKAIG